MNLRQSWQTPAASLRPRRCCGVTGSRLVPPVPSGLAHLMDVVNPCRQLPSGPSGRTARGIRRPLRQAASDATKSPPRARSCWTRRAFKKWVKTAHAFYTFHFPCSSCASCCCCAWPPMPWPNAGSTFLGSPPARPFIQEEGTAAASTGGVETPAPTATRGASQVGLFYFCSQPSLSTYCSAIGPTAATTMRLRRTRRSVDRNVSVTLALA
jgi:hypothetical protein